MRQNISFVLTTILCIAYCCNASTKTTTTTTIPTSVNNKVVVDPEVKKYYINQRFLLQSRLGKIRDELIKRGLPIPQDTSSDATATKQLTDWDCALSTNKYPKSCLYSLDAQENTKVIAPIDSTNWISLSSLIRLRRTDPSKVDPMWHDRYDILCSWFAGNSKQAGSVAAAAKGNSNFSLYQHLSGKGMLLTLLLDNDFVLSSVLAITTVIVAVLTRPLWEFVLKQLLVSSFFWNHWKTWGRVVHAALPLQLLVGQITYKFIAKLFIKLKNFIREILIHYECVIWEHCIPLTILEGKMKQQYEEEKLRQSEDFQDSDYVLENDEDEIDDDDDDDEDYDAEDDDDEAGLFD